MPSSLFAVGQLVLFHLEDDEFAAQINKAQHAGDNLRDVGGQRRTKDAELERYDEQQIEPDVQRAGQNQEIQRRFAVAQRTHNSRHHIVQKDERNTGKNPADIDNCAIDDVLRRLHQLHHRAGQRHGGNRQHYATHNAEPCRVGHVAAQVLVVPRTEQLCNGNGKAVADTANEAQNQIVDRAGCADRGQRADAAEPADNNCIGQRIELLEQVAQHQRQCEQKYNLEGIFACEILCHEFSYPIYFAEK